MKLKVLLILMLAAVTFTSYAQDGGIRGKVVSRNGRVALSNVQVKIESLGLTAMTDKDGNFIWPGYGDNMRVLDWILRRAKGKAEGQKTVLGVSPTYTELDKTGLDYSEEQFNANMALNPSEWQAELESQTELFDKVGKKLPVELEEQRQLLIKSFS